MRKLFAFGICCTFLVAWTVSLDAGQARLWEGPGPCDRECLTGMVDGYLAALVAHDPEAAGLSDDIRYTENTEVLNIGQGLWETASAVPATFKIYVPDPVARQVGFIGVMEAEGSPIQLSLRLKVESGEITEAEHMVARNLNEGSLPNLGTPRPGLLATVPPAERLSRELMIIVGASYYDSIEQSDGSATLYDDDCERRENGMITAGGGGIGRGGLPRQSCYDQMNSRVFTYIDDIDLRRVWIADEVTGLVFGLSQFRHAFENREFTIIGRDGERTTRTMNNNPFDFPATHIFKIRNSRIHDIEAMGFVMPYMSGNGWSEFMR